MEEAGKEHKMANPIEYKRDAMRGLLDDDVVPQVNVWLARGDGVAVYQNQAMNSAQLGHMQFVSYGSPTALIESNEPPTQMPDIGNQINWRYQLAGFYRGEQLPIERPDTLNPENWYFPHELVARLNESFESRGVAFYELKVARQRNGTEQVAIHLEVRCVAPNQNRVARVDIKATTDERGLIYKLGQFEWHVWNGVQHDGTAENLGKLLVDTYNLSMHPED